MRASRWLGVSLVASVLGGLLTQVSLAQSISPPVSSSQAPQPAPAERSPVAPDSAFAVVAVGATGLNFLARHAMCGVGDVLGFFTGSVLRAPLWILTLGDRLASTEALDRVGNSIIETACDGPLAVTPEQVKTWTRPAEGVAIGPRATMAEGQ